MNGLIWAGLGEGIAKAGTTFGTYMGKAIEEDFKEERDAKRQEAAERRQQALEIVKEQMAEKKAAFLAKQDADAAAAVETNTEAVLKSKGFQKFVTDLGPTEATPEQLVKVYLNTYHDRTVTAEPGGDRYDVRESERASERVNQARKVGASSGMVKSYVDELKQANKQDQERDDMRFREKVEARKEKEGQERIRQRDEQIAAMLARIGSTDRGDGKEKEKPPSRTDIQAVLKDAEGAIEKILTAGNYSPEQGRKRLESMANSKDPEKAARAKADLEKIAEQEEIANVARARLREMTGITTKADKPEDAKPASTKAEAPKVLDALPKGAVIVGTTKVNGVLKNVYQVPGSTKKYID